MKIVIEKYAKNARFCLICNLVSRIIPALQSRCTRFKFRHIPFQDAHKKIKSICEQERSYFLYLLFSFYLFRLNLTDEAIEALYKLCEGDMRKIVNMLQVLFNPFYCLNAE